MNIYLIVAILVIVLIALAYVAIRLGYKKQVSEILFYLVTKAESEFGGGTGEIKFAAVTAWLYERMPFVIRFIFTSKQIDILIEVAVNRMKEYLASNLQATKAVTGGVDNGS